MNENLDHMGLIPMDAELTMFYSSFTASLAIAKSQEQARIIKLAQDRICFDHKEVCEHGACYALSEIISVIKAE